MIYTKTLSSSLSERYEGFLLARPTTLLYQSWKYQCLLLDLLGCRQQGLVAVDADDNILAALPLMAMDGPLGTVLNSLPFYGSNGALIGEDVNAKSELISAYCKLLESSNIAASTLIENPLAPGGAADINYDFVDSRIGQLTPLPFGSDQEEVLMSSFHSKTRNMIRKSLKLGVELNIDNDAFPFLVSTHQENMREIGGTPKSETFFDSIPKYFSSDTDYNLFVAYLGGEAVAALLVFYYNQTVEYFTPVVKKEYRDTQSLSGLIFSAMSDAASKGYKWWNWGGTWLSQSGVYRFKSRWGTQDLPYKYFTSVHNPTVLKSDQQTLLRDYPSFFTVPFSALIS